MLLRPEKDPMGSAIAHYHKHGNSPCPLIVRSSMFEDDEMPIAHLFRTEAEMPNLERVALRNVRGRTLDVGAGAGCHSLVLQTKGIEVTAIDVSPLSVQTMRERGVVDVRHACFFDTPIHETFNTILLLMNGIGICGGLPELPNFFRRLDELLSPDGFALTDSCDLAYIFSDSDFPVDNSEAYYGEIDYTMHYGDVHGEAFNWLYVDEHHLRKFAEASGFRCKILHRGESHDFLARLERM